MNERVDALGHAAADAERELKEISDLGKRTTRALYAVQKLLNEQNELYNAANLPGYVSGSVNAGMQGSVFPARDIEKSCMEMVIRHMDKHIAEYRICQEDVDLYKVTAWLGFFFAQQEPRFRIEVVVAAMNSLLICDNRKLPGDFLRKVVHMARNDGKKDEFAIGMNGLYLIFRACYKMEALLTSNP